MKDAKGFNIIIRSDICLDFPVIYRTRIRLSTTFQHSVTRNSYLSIIHSIYVNIWAKKTQKCSHMHVLILSHTYTIDKCLPVCVSVYLPKLYDFD